MPQAADGFTAKDMQAVRTSLILKGVKAKEIVHYQGESCSFMDPDGNVIELWEEK